MDSDLELLRHFGVDSIWRKRVAPAHFELRRVLSIADHKVHTSSHINGDKTFFDYEFCDLYAPLGAEPSAISLAGSGHRPEDIARGARTLEEVRSQIYAFYVDLLRWLRPREVISGLARGFDLWLAWAAIETDTKLIGAAPYPSQANGPDWNAEEVAEWRALTAACAEMHMVSLRYWEKDGDNALHARNRWMVDRGTHLTSFWQGTRGGTANANDYAVKTGKPRLVINTLNGWS
jgi:uncharacterized phage-like protein YoqJ